MLLAVKAPQEQFQGILFDCPKMYLMSNYKRLMTMQGVKYFILKVPPDGEEENNKECNQKCLLRLKIFISE